MASADLLTGDVRRPFHPRKDRWADHFCLEGEFIEPLTDVGTVTVRLLRLKAEERLAERRLARVILLREAPTAGFPGGGGYPGGPSRSGSHRLKSRCPRAG